MPYGSLGLGSLFILGANIVLGLIGLFAAPKLIARCVFRPYEFARGMRRATLITHAFVHADLAHLLFNMLTFWFFGPRLEATIGTMRFALLYASGLLIAPLISYRKHRNDPNYATLGASGAIAAVLFAAIVYDPMMKIYFILLPIPIPAALFGAGYLTYSWWYGRQNRGRINHDAHFAGAVAGLVFVALTDPHAWERAIRRLFG
jgi:membrane associated rhomboid family serine protease